MLDILLRPVFGQLGLDRIRRIFFKTSFKLIKLSLGDAVGIGGLAGVVQKVLVLDQLSALYCERTPSPLRQPASVSAYLIHIENKNADQNTQSPMHFTSLHKGHIRAAAELDCDSDVRRQAGRQPRHSRWRSGSWRRCSGRRGIELSGLASAVPRMSWWEAVLE